MQFFGINFNVINPQNFQKGLQLIQESIVTPEHFYSADNIITWNRNFTFLQDKKFIKTVQENSNTDVELSIIWRTYILCHFAKMTTHLKGDFVEIGAYKGNTANIILTMSGIEHTNKNYYLYDTFEHQEGDLNHAMPEHSADLFNKVQKRFECYPFVKVIKGYVPQSFDKGFPEAIAFAHIDLNQAPAELAALNAVLPKLVPGGAIVLDDYGWWYYREQKNTQDPVLAAHGLSALELPTGQGIVIKPFADSDSDSTPPPAILKYCFFLLLFLYEKHSHHRCHWFCWFAFACLVGRAWYSCAFNSAQKNKFI